jgi:hypothetical protein
MQNERTFLPKFFPASLLGVSASVYYRALVAESEMVRTQMGSTID